MFAWLLVTAVLATSLRLVALFVVLGAVAPDLLCIWDCGWYHGIAEQGYAGQTHYEAAHVEAAWAFFPLLPLLTRAASRLTSLDTSAAMMLVSSLATIGLIVAGARYRTLTRPGSDPFDFVLVVVTLPWGVYFTTGYTEALYAFLAVLVLDAVARERIVPGCLASGLLTATRPTAVWLLPPLALAAYRHARRAPSRAAFVLRLAPLVVAVGGMLAWMAFLGRRAGDPLAFLHAEAGWGRHAADPLRVLLTPLLSGRGGAEAIYDAVFGVLGLAAAAWLARRQLWPEAFLLAATILTALLSGTRESLARYVVASPVFLLVVADLIERLPLSGRAFAFVTLTATESCLTAFWLRHAHFLV